MRKEMKKFAMQGLVGGFCIINSAILEREAMDPNTESFNKVDRKMI